MQTFLDALERQVACAPQKRAFTYLGDESAPQQITYEALQTRARAIAFQLSRTLQPGDRAVLLYPAGLAFIEAYLGCLYAGVIAVPLFPPPASRVEKSARRLLSIFRSASPGAVLSLSSMREVEAMRGMLPQGELLRWIHTDQLTDQAATLWRRPAITGDSVAFLQFTSGSTGAPKGVMVTHQNLIACHEMIARAFAITAEDVFCHWLPLYHDMGLIGHTLAPIQIGAEVYFMSPLDFLHRPARWLQAMSRVRGTVAAAPNFGYELCVRRVTEEESAGLDLSPWTRALNGAEPVSDTTMRRFVARFAGNGFRASYFRPCYGLAEATLLVSGTTHDEAPRVLTVDRAQLAQHRAVASTGPDETCARLVASGTLAPPGEVYIVDPVTQHPCPAGSVGEIWLRGAHVAVGYWRNDTETEESFAAHLADGAGPFLRTGDLGFLQGEHLFVTGRLKDLIVQRGTNYYPQDLERTAEEVRGVRPGAAAFGLTLGDAEEERVVVVVELDTKGPTAPPLEAYPRLLQEIREELALQHGAAIHHICAVPAGTIPRTSSGKVQRRATRELYETGALPLLAAEKPGAR